MSSCWSRLRTSPWVRALVLPVGLSFCVWLGGAPAVASPSGAAGADALQAVADIILVESECRDLNVDYGKLFAFAVRNGIRPLDIMPLGSRRVAFNAAYRRRALEIPGERLCTDFATALDETVPGVFTPR